MALLRRRGSALRRRLGPPRLRSRQTAGLRSGQPLARKKDAFSKVALPPCVSNVQGSASKLIGPWTSAAGMIWFFEEDDVCADHCSECRARSCGLSYVEVFKDERRLYGRLQRQSNRHVMVACVYLLERDQFSSDEPMQPYGYLKVLCCRLSQDILYTQKRPCAADAEWQSPVQFVRLHSRHTHPKNKDRQEKLQEGAMERTLSNDSEKNPCASFELDCNAGNASISIALDDDFDSESSSRAIDIDALSDTEPPIESEPICNAVIDSSKLRPPNLVPSLPCSGNQELLCVVVHSGHLNAVKRLIEDYCVDPRSSEGLSPIGCAAQGGHLDVVKFLVDKKASVNETSVDGWSPLMFAAAQGNLPMATFLAEDMRANVRKTLRLQNGDAANPWQIALSHNHMKVAAMIKDVMEPGCYRYRRGEICSHNTSKSKHAFSLEACNASYTDIFETIAISEYCGLRLKADVRIAGKGSALRVRIDTIREDLFVDAEEDIFVEDGTLIVKRGALGRVVKPESINARDANTVEVIFHKEDLLAPCGKIRVHSDQIKVCDKASASDGLQPLSSRTRFQIRSGVITFFASGKKVARFCIESEEVKPRVQILCDWRQPVENGMSLKCGVVYTVRYDMDIWYKYAREGMPILRSEWRRQFLGDEVFEAESEADHREEPRKGAPLDHLDIVPSASHSSTIPTKHGDTQIVAHSDVRSCISYDEHCHVDDEKNVRVMTLSRETYSTFDISTSSRSLRDIWIRVQHLSTEAYSERRKTHLDQDDRGMGSYFMVGDILKFRWKLSGQAENAGVVVQVIEDESVLIAVPQSSFDSRWSRIVLPRTHCLLYSRCLSEQERLHRLRESGQACGSCDVSRVDSKKLRCGRCLRVCYCSRECQTSHWKVHRLQCTVCSDSADNPHCDHSPHK